MDEALPNNLFDRSSYLYEEPGNLLKQELREPAIYNAIIKAIAEELLQAQEHGEIHLISLTDLYKYTFNPAGKISRVI